MKNSKLLLKRAYRFLCVGAAIPGLLLLSGCQNGEEASAEAAQETILENEMPAEAESGDRGEAVLSVVSAMDTMCAPNGIADMGDGKILITDLYHKQLWQAEEGVSELYAGGDTVESLYGEPLGGYSDGELMESYFGKPWDVAEYLDGWAVSDTDNNVIRVVRGQKVQTFNGRTEGELIADDSVITFSRPTGLASDGNGNLYVADTGNGAIRMLGPEGTVTTVADGLNEPMGLCMDNDVLYIAEAGANRIVKIEGGKLSVVAGSGAEGFEDGSAQQALFASPQGIAVGDDGTIYVSDTLNSAIRRIANGQVETVVARDIASAEFGLIRPIGMLAVGERLYICDSFARKVFMLEWKEV